MFVCMLEILLTDLVDTQILMQKNLNGNLNLNSTGTMKLMIFEQTQGKFKYSLWQKSFD